MQLSNPPLVEALLEIKFDVPWDAYDYAVELSDFRSAVKGEFDTVEQVPGTEMLPLKFPEFVTRHRLFNGKKSKLISFGENLISYNHLDYTDSSDYFSDLEKVLGLYDSVKQKDKISRIGLRYIDKLPIKDGISIDEIFTFGLQYPENLSNVVAFDISYLNEFKKGDFQRLKVVKNPNENFIFLDTDFFTSSLNDFDVKKIMSWAQDSHRHVAETFEKSLTKKYYKTLV